MTTIDSNVMNVATTELPGQFSGSQSGVGSDLVNNQLGAALQHGIKSSQGSRGVALYSPLSVGLGGSRADLEIISNTLGLGANMPPDPYAMDRASGGEQVNLSLRPPVPCSDRPSEHRQCPGPNPRPTVPPSTTPRQEYTPIVRLE
jgi:hypothetical protein